MFCLLYQLFLLLVDPVFELPDGFTLHRQLDVGISCVDPRSCRVAHERHANFLQDAGLHQAGIKGVAEIVETDMADTAVFERGLPGAFHDSDRLAPKTNYQAFCRTVFEQ
jgi:hypothetical protein